MTDEEIQKRIQILQIKYRKAVRREYFRRQGALKRLLRMAGAGNSAVASAAAECSPAPRGVAPLPLGNEVPPLPASPSAMPPGVNEPNLSRKAMPERDDETKGQTDYLSSSSGCDMLTGIEQATKDQATPGQEQKPAMTEMTSNAVGGAQTHK